MLVEFDPTFCRILAQRYPSATVVQGDAYGLRTLLDTLMREPAAAVVSGLPLFTKPLKLRLPAATVPEEEAAIGAPTSTV